MIDMRFPHSVEGKKGKYSTNFLISFDVLSRVTGEAGDTCELFLTSLAKTFLEERAVPKIIRMVHVRAADILGFGQNDMGRGGVECWMN